MIDRFETAVVDGWACWAVSNHDVNRVATRWQVPGGAAANAAWQRQVFMLQACLRGSVCIYQGDELGLTDVQVPFEQLQDPFGITMWPEFKGRDGCRTPMAWDAALPNAGFSEGASCWLPVASEHLPLAAAQAAGDPASLLNLYRATLAWRKSHQVLRVGALSLLPADDAVLAFVRHGDGGTPLLCVFNLDASPRSYTLPAKLAHGQPNPWQVTGDIEAPASQAGATRQDQTFTLPPYSAAFASLQQQN